MNSLQTITETNPCFLCCFCKSGKVDDVNFGQLFMYDGVVVHYFCMLFSAALSQHGSDDEGILGFLPNDIMGEVRRSLRLKCSFCNIAGASVGCCNKRCRTAFHFPCGLKNGANYQFYGNYESYCSDHLEFKKITLPRKDWVCPICTSPVVLRNDAVQPNQCCGSAVFHKECLQKLALSSGYFFKCPMCNNGKEFVQEMRSKGIFVPEQDASWEREPHAYEELYRQHSICDAAPVCLCPKGTTYSAQKGNWIFARCRICGAAGTHKLCSGLQTVDNWACEPCFEVEIRTEKEKEKQQLIIKTEIGKPVKKKKVKIENDGGSVSSEQEAYVSARSGNRKVRNGRLNNRPSTKKSQPWKFSDLYINDNCFWYFPYGKEKLEKYEKKGTIPDHRKLCLQVNLVNWIPKSLFGNTKKSLSQKSKAQVEKKIVNHPIATTTTTTSKVKQELNEENQLQNEIIIKKEAELLLSPIEPLKKLKKIKKVTPKVIRKRKKSLWDKGVIKKKTNKGKKQHIIKGEILLNSEFDNGEEQNNSLTINDNPSSSPSPTLFKAKEDLTDNNTNNDSSKINKFISPGSSWTIENPEDIVYRNLQSQNLGSKQERLKPRNLFDEENGEMKEMNTSNNNIDNNNRASDSDNNINGGTTEEFWSNMDIQSSVEVQSDSCEVVTKEKETKIKLTSSSLLSQIPQKTEPPNLTNHLSSIFLIDHMETESNNDERRNSEKSEKRSSGSPESGISFSMDDVDMIDESKSSSEFNESSSLHQQQQNSKPLNELNTDKDVVISPTKLSFLMSSKTMAIIPEEKPLHATSSTKDYGFSNYGTTSNFYSSS